MTERTTLSDLRYARKALAAVKTQTTLMDYSQPQEHVQNIRQIVDTALEETEEQMVPFYRADQRTVCTNWLSIYREHPLDRRKAALSDQGIPFLRVLCNGERVKL